jgi:hypothetical protein
MLAAAHRVRTRIRGLCPCSKGLTGIALLQSGEVVSEIHVGLTLAPASAASRLKLILTTLAPMLYLDIRIYTH